MCSYFVLSLESPLHYARCAPVSPSARDATPHSRQCSALWRTHPLRHALPLPCRHRQPPMPDARWQRRQRRTARQSQCLETWRLHRAHEGSRPLPAAHGHAGETCQPHHLVGPMCGSTGTQGKADCDAPHSPHPCHFGQTTPSTRKGRAQTLAIGQRERPAGRTRRPAAR